MRRPEGFSLFYNVFQHVHILYNDGCENSCLNYSLIDNKTQYIQLTFF